MCVCVCVCVYVCVCVCVGSVKKLVRRESSDRGFSVQELTLHFPLLSHSKVGIRGAAMCLDCHCSDW